MHGFVQSKGDAWIADETGITFKTPAAFKEWLNVNPLNYLQERLAGLTSYLTPYLSQATTAVQSAGGTVATAVADSANTAADVAQNAGTAVVNMATEGANTVAQAVKSVGEAVATMVTEGVEAVAQASQNKADTNKPTQAKENTGAQAAEKKGNLRGHDKRVKAEIQAEANDSQGLFSGVTQWLGLGGGKKSRSRNLRKGSATVTKRKSKARGTKLRKATTTKPALVKTQARKRKATLKCN